MKISNLAIKLLIAKTKPAFSMRMQLAVALSCTEVWICELLKQNKENGKLTTIKAIQVIRRETGLNQEDILTGEPAEVAN